MSEATSAVICPRCKCESHTGEPLGQYIVTYAECPVCRADNLASRLDLLKSEADSDNRTLFDALEKATADRDDALRRLDGAALEFENLVSLGLPYWTQEHVDRMRAALKGRLVEKGAPKRYVGPDGKELTDEQLASGEWIEADSLKHE